MKRILVIVALGLFFYNNSYSAIKGTGELKMSNRAVNHFISWCKKKEFRDGRRCKPSMFIMSSDGQWSQGNICCYSSCQDTRSKKIIKACERETGTLCGVFSIRRTIYWDNGINKKKNKAKFSSKWSDEEFKSELTRLGFYGGTKTSQVKPKITKKSTTTSSNNSSVIVDKLRDLKKLYDEGVLTKEDFEKAKKKILN